MGGTGGRAALLHSKARAEGLTEEATDSAPTGPCLQSACPVETAGSVLRMGSLGRDISTLQDARSHPCYSTERQVGRPPKSSETQDIVPPLLRLPWAWPQQDALVCKTRLPPASLQLGEREEGGGRPPPSLGGQATQAGQPPGARCPRGLSVPSSLPFPFASYLREYRARP